MRGKAFWLLFFTVLLSNQGRAAAIDGWVLALSWQPGFCAGHAAAPGCLESAGPRLTFHGLWPEARDPEDEGFCAVAPETRALDQAKAWCRLPVPDLSPRTSAALNEIMPDKLACLDRHEWIRHGTCSGLSAEDYFASAVRLATRVEELAVGKMLVSRAGTAATLADLTRAVAVDFGADDVAAFTFICDRTNGPYLTEMRISLAVDGPRSFPASAALHMPAFRAARLCPADALIRIDGGR